MAALASPLARNVTSASALWLRNLIPLRSMSIPCMFRLGRDARYRSNACRTAASVSRFDLLLHAAVNSRTSPTRMIVALFIGFLIISQEPQELYLESSKLELYGRSNRQTVYARS